MNFIKELYFGEELNPQQVRGAMSALLAQVVDSVGARNGIAVLLSSDEVSFEEVAAYGYANGSFYYDFMARGGGNFEKMQLSGDPMFFRSNSHDLSDKDSQMAVVVRIFCKGKLWGFILLEFKKDPAAFVLEYLGLIAYRIAEGLTGGDAEKRELATIAYLLANVPELKSSIGKIQPRDVILISGPLGAGKKTIAKYIHREFISGGRFLVLSSYPEQPIKLERSLQNWAEMAAGGVVVFDKIHELTENQQATFFQYLKTFSGFTPIFLDSMEKKTPYSPFWELLGKTRVIVPPLDTLSKSVLEDLIEIFFEEIMNVNNRKGLRLSENAKKRLKFGNYPANFKDLRSILESSIMSATGTVLEEADLKMEAPVSSSLDAEDLDLRRCVESLERQKIQMAERLFSGNQIRMAKALGISRGSLQYKMRQMGMS